jgi:hypothetical protein
LSREESGSDFDCGWGLGPGKNLGLNSLLTPSLCYPSHTKGQELLTGFPRYRMREEKGRLDLKTSEAKKFILKFHFKK